MGCFPPLRIPNEFPQDNSQHAENWRFVDRWANTLTIDPDCVSGGGCPVARGQGFGFAGTVSAGSDIIIEDSFGGTVNVAGDMTWDGTAGGFIVPRDGFYTASMVATIDCTPVTDPYWIGFTVMSESSFQLPPFNVAIPFTQTFLYYLSAGDQIQFRIDNDETASVDLDFTNLQIHAVETPCSAIA